MSKWQKISVVLAGLLLFSCVTMAGLGLWVFVSNGGGSVLAAMTGKTPTLAPAAAPTAGPTAAPSVQSPLTAPPAVPGTGQAQIGGVFGTVTTVTGSTVTMAAANGTSRTLTVGPQMRVIFAGMPNATVSDIQTGDKLLAIGLRRSAGAFQPRVLIVAPSTYTQANIEAGTIQSVSGETLTVTPRNASLGPVTINLDANTQVYAQNLQPLQPSSLTAGEAVIVIGEPNSDGSMTAQVILAGTGRRIPQNQPGTPNNVNPLPTLVPSPTQTPLLSP